MYLNGEIPISTKSQRVDANASQWSLNPWNRKSYSRPLTVKEGTEAWKKILSPQDSCQMAIYRNAHKEKIKGNAFQTFFFKLFKIFPVYCTYWLKLI